MWETSLVQRTPRLSWSSLLYHHAVRGEIARCYTCVPCIIIDRETKNNRNTLEFVDSTGMFFRLSVLTTVPRQTQFALKRRTLPVIYYNPRTNDNRCSGYRESCLTLIAITSVMVFFWEVKAFGMRYFSLEINHAYNPIIFKVYVLLYYMIVGGQLIL